MKDNKSNLIIIIILLAIISFFNCINIKQEKYIQNLETKVNILTVDYEEFSLEDSLKQ